MKSRMRSALAYGLMCAALWLGMWGVIDETALEMAAVTPQEETETGGEAPEESTVRFEFPWLEMLLQALGI